jgi:hypothetical protein
MSASIFGSRAARRRIVDAVAAGSAVARNICSAASCGPDNIIVSKRRSVGSVRKEITTKKGLGRLLKNDPRFPVVWNVWRIDVPNLLATEINDLAVG